jgi:recombination protein RecT
MAMPPPPNTNSRPTTAPPALGPGTSKANAERPKQRTIADLFESKKASLQAAAGKFLDADKLVKVALSCVLKNPKLGACTEESLVAGLAQCAEWGVYPGGGTLAQAYLIPRENSYNINGKWVKKKEATAQLSYQGMLTQARRANPDLVDVEARVVYEGDGWECVFGFKPKLEHVPKWDGPRADKDVTLVYALAWIRGYEKPHVEVMTKAEVNEVRTKASKNTTDSPWDTWFGEMAKKTVLKRLVKAVGGNPELQAHLAKDDEADDVVDGTFTSSAQAGVSAPPVRGALPATTNAQTLEDLFAPQQERELAPLQPEEEHDPRTGELPPVEPQDEDELALERLRKADQESKRVQGESAAPQQPQPPAEFSGDADELILRMGAAESLEQLSKLAKLSERVPANRQEELGKLFVQRRAALKARTP